MSLNKAVLVFIIVLFGFLYLKPAFAESSGQYLFSYYNCIDCHSVNGNGGTLGPSLTHYGAKNKGIAWTIVQIENPSSHFKKGNTVKINGKDYYVLMPSFGYIPYRDVRILASYLESLK